MGQSGSVRIMYGWKLTEEETERFEDEDGDDSNLYDWTTDNGLDYDVGGNYSYDWTEYVVGAKLDPWISDLGAHEIPDNFGEIDVSEYERLKPFVEYFGREPRKYLVMSYG